MGRRICNSCGFVLIGCALVALPLSSIVASYLGGSASHGYVEDGRYFVGGHSRISEVSEFAWWLELRLSQSFPWATLAPLLLGLMLIHRHKAVAAVAPAPSSETMVISSVVGVGVALSGAALGWLLGRAPWTMEIGFWLGIYAGTWLAFVLVKRLEARKVKTSAD